MRPEKYPTIFKPRVLSLYRTSRSRDPHPQCHPTESSTWAASSQLKMPRATRAQRYTSAYTCASPHTLMSTHLEALMHQVTHHKACDGMAAVLADYARLFPTLALAISGATDGELRVCTSQRSPRRFMPVSLEIAEMCTLSTRGSIIGCQRLETHVT